MRWPLGWASTSERSSRRFSPAGGSPRCAPRPASVRPWRSWIRRAPLLDGERGHHAQAGMAGERALKPVGAGGEVGADRDGGLRLEGGKARKRQLMPAGVNDGEGVRVLAEVVDVELDRAGRHR